MINSQIISEFEKLIAFYKNELDKMKKSEDVKNLTANTFRIRQLRNVVSILSKYPEKITLKNYQELKELDGIGAGTIQRI
jgi:dsDNA-specific endonuclease/ATPase MutS2